ncbi:MAG: phosphoribosylformylglycinamidine synthase, partial [Candidatus Peregrinibacteria bacterium]
MAHRIEILTKVNDTRSEIMKKKLNSLGFSISQSTVLEVYTINKTFPEKTLNSIAEMLSNPVSQTFKIDSPITTDNYNFALEIGYLPGITDNIGNTAKETVEDFTKEKFDTKESIHSSTLILLKGKLTENDTQQIGSELANSLIQSIRIKPKGKGMDPLVPQVNLTTIQKADKVNLNISEEELLKLGKEGIPNEDGARRGPLALDKEYLNTIKDYFKKEDRQPTDIELESLAQTWSEHCKHTIFAAKIDDNEEGLYKGFIKRATQEIRKSKGTKDFCVSVFKDNSGGIIFDKDWVITDKAETHNSPSALDPFGGAITGIVGVNRDTIGFGLGAKPII